MGFIFSVFHEFIFHVKVKLPLPPTKKNEENTIKQINKYFILSDDEKMVLEKVCTDRIDIHWEKVKISILENKYVPTHDGI